MPTSSDFSTLLRQFVQEWKANPNRQEYIGDNPFGKFVLMQHATSWDDFLGWLNQLQGSWCFRGQRDARWLLHTSLDRAVEREHSGTHSTVYHHLDRETEQRELLFRFQQQAHLYIRHLPAVGDLASWFALMQHHGAPTRFLDWTESPYVAAYFAVEEKAQANEKCSAVWAINLDWLGERGLELLPPESKACMSNEPDERAWRINGLLARENDDAVIIRIDPLQTDERIAAQQGLFLCRLLHMAPFSQTLMRMMMVPQTPDQPVVRKLEVGGNQRTVFLKNLRAMNIHRASLFPGLDGFGQSLKINLELRGLI